MENLSKSMSSAEFKAPIGIRWKQRKKRKQTLLLYLNLRSGWAAFLQESWVLLERQCVSWGGERLCVTFSSLPTTHSEKQGGGKKELRESPSDVSLHHILPSSLCCVSLHLFFPPPPPPPPPHYYLPSCPHASLCLNLSIYTSTLPPFCYPGCLSQLANGSSANQQQSTLFQEQMGNTLSFFFLLFCHPSQSSSLSFTSRSVHPWQSLSSNWLYSCVWFILLLPSSALALSSPSLFLSFTLSSLVSSFTPSAILFHRHLSP